MAKQYVYQFYAELKDYEPKIWRRFEINGGKNMAEFSYAIMIMFEMQGSHLFSLKQFFREVMLNSLKDKFTEDEVNNVIVRSEFAKNIRYEFPVDEVLLAEDERFVQPETISLYTSLKEVGTKFILEYDFGDGWEVELTLESIDRRDISLSLLPRVIEGEGFGIIEDIGGVGGLTHLAEVLKTGKGEEYDFFTDWLDTKELNLEEFDKEDMNVRLKKLQRVYRDSYEYQLSPTTASLNLLLRNYKGKGRKGY